MSVTEAVQSRQSVRAFLDTVIDRHIVESILAKAARAPSGTNMQPWKCYVLSGEARNELCTKACEAYDSQSSEYDSEVRYYPEKWFEPYISRRRKVGWDLYSLLNIEKGDRDNARKQHRRNYQFFDAPIGLIFTIHRELATGSWLDYGTYLQNIMLLARECNLDTCPQAAWADYHAVVRTALPITDDEVVVCGMAMGYKDDSAIENTLSTERADLTESALFLWD